MAKIYIVMGTTGEYSDRSEWPVAAYFDVLKAQEHVENATKVAQGIEVTRTSPYWTHPDQSNQYDPNMQMDYTGTQYFLMDVEIKDGKDLR
jgi:hypothetical protein